MSGFRILSGSTGFWTRKRIKGDVTWLLECVECEIPRGILGCCGQLLVNWPFLLKALLLLEIYFGNYQRRNLTGKENKPPCLIFPFHIGTLKRYGKYCRVSIIMGLVSPSLCLWRSKEVNAYDNALATAQKKLANKISPHFWELLIIDFLAHNPTNSKLSLHLYRLMTSTSS